MKTRRRISPLTMLLTLALLLFTSGFMAGWAGASVSAWAGQAQTPVQAPATAESESFLPSQGSDSPAPAAADDWALILVNWENPLPNSFAAPALTKLRNSQAIDSRAYPALQAMMDGARAEGLQPLICSSYRDQDTQARLFEAETQSWLDRGHTRGDAEAQAAAWVARPGTSEHQTGLAADIVDISYQSLDQGQENTPVQKWLMAHCAEYGFILRYPTGKSGLTGVNYEPWHYRYVGTDAAKEIMAAGLCLEEYLLRE